MQSVHTPSTLSLVFDDDHAVANARLARAVYSVRTGLRGVLRRDDLHRRFPERRAARLPHFVTFCSVGFVENGQR